MKTIRLLLSMGLVVGAMATGSPARACGFGVRLCVPFFSFDIGFGVGGLCAAPVYACARPVYGCAVPTYCRYDCPAPAYDPPEREFPIAAPVAPAAPVWVPSTAGAGHWVPDPQPYRYAPAPMTENKAASVTISRSAGGVPVYSVNEQR